MFVSIVIREYKFESLNILYNFGLIMKDIEYKILYILCK